MKSPLVEALRLANGSFAEMSPVDDSPAPVADNQQLPDPGELQLMESSAFVRVDDDSEVLLDDSIVIANDDEDATFEAPVNDRVAPKSFSAPTAVASHRLRVRRIGKYSPWICVALALTASAGYFGYQQLAGRLQDAGLQAVAAQPDTRNAGEAHQSANEQAAGGYFKLTSGSPRAALTASKAASIPESIPVSVPTSSNTSSNTPNKSFDDPAYGLINDAFNAYRAGDLAAAEVSYRRALDIAPRHPNALHGLAAVLQRNGRFAESRQFYESLLSVEPGNTAAATALLAQNEGDSLDSSMSDVRALLQRHPDSASLHFALGILLAQESRWTEARHVFANASRLESGNADYLFNLAVSLEHLGRYVEARRYYGLALDNSDIASMLDDEVVMARIANLAPYADTEVAGQ
jgi:tetratricopeptide (TPR) repeat protein